MLSNIITQIQKEREQDRTISSQTGTNRRHDLTNIPGHRKVGQNSFFSMSPIPKKVLAPAARAPEPTPAPEATPAPEETPAPATEIIPKGMSRAAMRKKQREEENAKRREQEKEAAQTAQTEQTAQTPAPEPTPAPAPIELESTVSE